MNPILILFIGIAIVLTGIIVLRLHAFLTLIIAALVVGILTSSDALYQFALHQGMGESEALSLANQTIGKRLSTAFGNTCAKVGILIAMASVIGTCLLKSGAADRIIRSSLRVFGEKRAPLAFLTSGFTLAIPVFFDTVFYLMIPLAKSLGIRFPQKYGLLIMAIIAGGVMAHSLVPPTPGPLFVAQELGVDLGMMILGGLVVGVVTVLAGYLYAIWINRSWKIPLRDTADASIEELEAYSQKPTEALPGFFWSITPILLPLLLIAGNTILKVTVGQYPEASRTMLDNTLLSIMATLGDSNIALIISALFALALMRTKIKDNQQYARFLQESLQSAGIIILITAAGGALGGMLQQTGIGLKIESLAQQYQLAVLPLAFLVTALVRTAQGSATVAMITAVGIVGGMSSPETLGFHPVYLALAIGCGSKPFPWMNDSGFWIITKMSGMTEREAIRHFSLLLTIMGVVGLFTTMLLANFFPMI